jgi:hypothetical protein
MTYRIHYGVLRTGSVVGELPVASCSFGDELRSTGSFQAQVAVGQAGNGALWQATRGAYTFWAAEWFDQGGRRLVAGGPILPRSADANSITFGGSNLFAMMGHRKLVNQAWTDAQISTSALTSTALDLGSIIRAIVVQVSSDLPIVYEASRSGTNTRTFPGFELAWAADKITEIGNVESGTGGLGGPDWVFTPRFVAGDFTHIEWVLTTGTAAQPWLTQTGPVVVLDKGAPNQQNVGDVTVSEDAAKIATTAFNAGGGTDAAKVIATATDPTLTNAGYPRMDADSTSNANDRPTVQAYAQGLLTRSKRAPAGVTVQVKASWWWAQGGGVGTTVQLLDPKNPMFGSINLTSRVIKWDVQDVASEWVSLTLADTLAGV